MSEYHKINTVFKRDPDNKHKSLLIGQYSTEELGYLKDAMWVWSEKIDGMNIRIIAEPGKDGYSIRGKTDRALVPDGVVNYIRGVLSGNKIPSMFGDKHVVLYGEGYGAGIQRGDKYCSDQKFMLFDVTVDGLFLDRICVGRVALATNFWMPADVGIGTLEQAVEFARQGFTSYAAETPHTMAEGLVMRPLCELRTRRGDRIITKIKHKDFRMETAQ